jgi:hypothetical protein
MPGSAAARAMLAVAFVLAALVSIDTARPSGTAAAMPGEGPYVDEGTTMAPALPT